VRRGDKAGGVKEQLIGWGLEGRGDVDFVEEKESRGNAKWSGNVLVKIVEKE